MIDRAISSPMLEGVLSHINMQRFPPSRTGQLTALPITESSLSPIRLTGHAFASEDNNWILCYCLFLEVHMYVHTTQMYGEHWGQAPTLKHLTAASYIKMYWWVCCVHQKWMQGCCKPVQSFVEDWSIASSLYVKRRFDSNNMHEHCPMRNELWAEPGQGLFSTCWMSTAKTSTCKYLIAFFSCVCLYYIGVFGKWTWRTSDTGISCAKHLNFKRCFLEMPLCAENFRKPD